jgi:WD40 repeat protein
VALAARAELSRSIQPDQALLLGIEAYKIAPTLEAFGALLTGLQSSAGLMAYLYPGAAVFSVAFSPDGKILASASTGAGDTVRLWEVATHRALGEPLQGHTGFVFSVAFSPDGKTLASASLDQTVRLWDVDPQSWISRTCTIVNRNLSFGGVAAILGNECSVSENLPSATRGHGSGD